MVLDRAPPHPPKLFERTVKAGIWTLGNQGVGLGIRLLSTLIMTRLLFPSAFGQVAAATSLMTGLALISDVGIRTVILQSRHGNEEAFLRTAWTLQVCRGAILWVILVVICAIIGLPFIRRSIPAESVFSSPQFFSITTVIGINLLIGGFSSAAVDLCLRQLNLKPLYLLEIAARLFSLPIMIVWAWISPSVWVLVGGALLASTMRLVLTHIVLPGPRMRFWWNKEYVREIVHFGKWINVSSVAAFIGGQSDRLILGFLLPSSLFGVYAIAKLLIETSQAVFDRLSSTLTLPVLSEVIRRDHRDLQDRFYRFRFPFDCSAPLLGGILLVAGSLIVGVLFDKRYSDAGLMVQILGVGFLIYPSLLIRPVFTANGEPHVAAIVSVIQAAASILCLTLGFLIAGLNGAVGGIAINRLVPSAVALLYGRQRGWVNIAKELRVFPVFVVGLGLGEIALAIARAAHIVSY